MRKRIISVILAVLTAAVLLPSAALAMADDTNGDWSAQSFTLRNTSEAELMVRAGDIDALNDDYATDDGYNPFTAKRQRSHGYPWNENASDAAGTDRIFVGTAWNGESRDGYSGNYNSYYTSGNTYGNAYGDGALVIRMSYDASGIKVKNALLQLCIDDFQAVSFDSVFTVKLNGKDAPFIAELLNHVDQTGPTSYIVSAIIPPAFFEDVSSGNFEITIDETTGTGDGFAVDFAKLLVNYNSDIFKGTFKGQTEPYATVRLLGTSTTVTASADGGFEFEAIPGLNAIRASKDGYTEGYEFGIVVASDGGDDDEAWRPDVYLSEGEGHEDIDFSQFGATNAWGNASEWATGELAEAAALGLIPDSLIGEDLTKPITRAEFAAVSVKVYEALTGQKAEPVAINPFTDTDDIEVLKAYNVGVTNGMSATEFKPDVLLNREQAATMLTRVYKKIAIEGWTLETDSAFNDLFKDMFEMPDTFDDDDKISGWAKDSVYFMVANGIIKGTGNNKFSPRATTDAEKAMGYAQATREQALLIATRMVKNLD